MDKKSNNTGISKSILKSLNRSYVSEPIKDENKIVDIMSKFLNGELDTINSIIESNEILNFKDSTGQTLIHAIIKNESPNITEENKLQIIRMLVDKNVSLNSMTQLNQNPLHLACQKGYVSIIIYLLSNGCEQKLNDNIGNAPIHYLIDKFIDSCKQDDFYKPANKEIKEINSGHIKKINEIIKKQNLNILIKLFEDHEENGKKYTIVKDANTIINTLNKFIKYSTQNLLPQIYKIMDSKIADINKIFLDKIDSNENKLQKAKNIILNTRDEIKNIYKFNLDDNTIIWDNFILNQKIKIINNKKTYIEKINENIKKIGDSLINQTNKIDNIKDLYYNPYINYIFSVTFITLFITENYNLKRLNVDNSNIQKKYFLPTTYAFDESNGKLNISSDRLSQSYEQLHVGISTINEKNNGDLVLLEGLSNDNYGLLKVDFYDVSGNVYDVSGNVYDLTSIINNFIDNNLTNIFLFDNILGNNINSDNLKTLLCTDQLNVEIHNLPFNLNDDDDEGILYSKGFSKLSHPKTNIFEEDEDEENNKKRGNRNIKLWVYDIYLPTIPLTYEMIIKLDSNLHDKEFVIGELKELQKKRNNRLINNYLKGEPNILNRFVENTLINISNVDITKVKEYYQKSLDSSRDIMIDQVKSNNSLVTKILSDTIISNENLKKAIVLNTDLAIEIGRILFEQIPRMLLYELNNVLINAGDVNNPFIKIEEYHNFIGLIEISNVILRTVFDGGLVQNIIQYIINNNALMDRIRNIPIPVPPPAIASALIAYQFFDRIKKLINYDEKQMQRELWNICELRIRVPNNLNQQYINMFTRVRTSISVLLNLSILKFIFNNINAQIPPTTSAPQINTISTIIIRNINVDIDDIFLNNNRNIQQVVNSLNVVLDSFINTGLHLVRLQLYPNISIDINLIYNNLLNGIQNPADGVMQRLQVPINYIEIVTGVALILYYNYANTFQYNIQLACIEAYDIINLIMQNVITANLINLNIDPDLNSKNDYNIRFAYLTNAEVTPWINNIINGIDMLIKNEIDEIIRRIANRYITTLPRPPLPALPALPPPLPNQETLYINPTDMPIQLPESAEKKITDIIITKINKIIVPPVLSPQQKLLIQLLAQNAILQPITDSTTIINSSKALISSGIGIIADLGTEDEKKNIRVLLSEQVWDLITLRPNYIEIPSVIANCSSIIASFGNTLITTSLIDKYLPDPNYIDHINFLPLNMDKEIIFINDKYYFDKKLYFKYIPIRNLIIYIKESINTIIAMLQFNSDEDKFREYIHQFDLLYSKQFTNILISIINNLVILEKYVFQIDFSEYNNLINEFNILISNLTNQASNDTINIINILSNIKNRYQNILQESIKKIKDNKIIKDITEIYNEIIKIFGIFGELVENINKYQSEFQLEKYNDLIYSYVIDDKNPKTNIKTNIKIDIKIEDTLFSNYTFDIRKKFPDNYNLYKTQYFDINIDINMYKLADVTKKILDDKKIFKFENYPCNLIQDVFPYTNTYNFNIFYNKQNDILINEIIFNIDKISIQNKNYDFNKFSLNKSNPYVYKFARGYDINNDIIKQNYINDELIKLKEDKNILCNIDFIKQYSNVDNNNKVLEDAELVAKYFFEDDLKITEIDFCTYLLTNNLGEIVNLIVCLIYSKIIKDNALMDIFFSNSTNNSLTLYEIGTINTQINNIIKVGIDLEAYPIDSKYKKNIFDTLEFIKTNENEKNNYILENIKIFVKVILETQINNEIGKILEQIKINYPNPSNNIININKKEITIFNNNISKIKSKSNQLEEIISNIINSTLSSTLEYNQLIRIIKNTSMSNNKNTKKLIGNKCINTRMTDELLNIEFNYKVLDLNGNTILNRLIDQYNLYGIQKIIKSKPFLKTYKNNNNLTPVEYLLNQILNIQGEYKENNLEQRIKKYSIVLTNLTEASELFKNISLENSENLVKEIITNSIYLFNEVMWLKLYEFPTGWEISDKKKLKEILCIGKEELLIANFNNSDYVQFKTNDNSELKNKLDLYTGKLEEEIKDYENKINQYKTFDPDLLISEDDISGNIKNYDELIINKNKIKKEHEKYIKGLESTIDKSIANIKIIYNNKEKKLIKSTNINWVNYEKMVYEMDSNYLKIIKILNGKINNKSVISNFLPNIMKFNIEKNEINNINTINKYFDKIFDNVFADYWDLDRYEDLSYNILNESIICILKVNVIGIIKNELFNTLINYIIQKNIYTKDIKTFIESKSNSKTILDSILDSIKSYLYDSMITKLKQKNPDKLTYIDLDTQKKIILGEFGSLVGNIFDADDLEELDKILEFNKFLCENISYNCYEEIIKILYDCKKISILYKIYNELKI